MSTRRAWRCHCCRELQMPVESPYTDDERCCDSCENLCAEIKAKYGADADVITIARAILEAHAIMGTHLMMEHDDEP